MTSLQIVWLMAIVLHQSQMLAHPDPEEVIRQMREVISLSSRRDIQ